MSRNYRAKRRVIYITEANTRTLAYNQELNWDPTHIPKGDASYSKWNVTIKVMFDVISDGEDYPDSQYQANVVQRFTSCPDSSKFNDYSYEQLVWLHKFMTIAYIILEQNDPSLNREIVINNRILDTLYAKQEDVSKIKLSDDDRANALFLLNKYSNHAKMQRLANAKKRYLVAFK
jgi:hypothetical protein